MDLVWFCFVWFGLVSNNEALTLRGASVRTDWCGRVCFDISSTTNISPIACRACVGDLVNLVVFSFFSLPL